MTDDPYEIFILFFDDETLTILANNTTEYAQVHPAPADKPHTRTWSLRMKEELRAYIAAYVWMGVYLEKEVKDFWNTDPAKGLIHDIVRQHISLNVGNKSIDSSMSPSLCLKANRLHSIS